MTLLNKSRVLHVMRTKSTLLISMLLIGLFTVFASANTYEVITNTDIPFSSVVRTVDITTNVNYDKQLKLEANENYGEGVFGVPAKIKLPETKQHIDIIPAKNDNKGWLANKGLGQVFVVDNAKQKVFGSAVIYLRYDTPTTEHLGDVLTGDMVNIVTTDGWQLGYKVTQTTDDLSKIDQTLKKDTSRIIVVMINDKNPGSIKCFQASLAKVGERI